MVFEAVTLAGGTVTIVIEAVPVQPGERVQLKEYTFVARLAVTLTLLVEPAPDNVPPLQPAAVNTTVLPCVTVRLGEAVSVRLGIGTTVTVPMAVATEEVLVVQVTV